MLLLGKGLWKPQRMSNKILLDIFLKIAVWCMKIDVFSGVKWYQNSLKLPMCEKTELSNG